MDPYILYVKKCPGVDNPRDYKVGVSQTKSARGRLATYQNAVGPVYTEQFEIVWAGEDIDVKEAEKKLKRFFKERISSAESGFSEWLCNTTLDEILEYVRELREEHFIKLVDVPEEFLPLTMPKCEDLQEWFDEYLEEESKNLIDS